MLASLIIVFREVLEAGLIVGIVLAATQGVPNRTAWVGGGVAAGAGGALLFAFGAALLSDKFADSGQELVNALVLCLAVVMLGWHNIWMASHGRALAGEMKAVGRAVVAGERPLHALAVVIAVAVLREGAEVVLFLQGVVVSGDGDTVAVLTGGVAGIASGAILSIVLYRGLIAIPARHLFGVISWMIALLAAGMAAQAVALFTDAGLVDIWTEVVWDTSSVLSDRTLIGRTLHALAGYTDRPTGLQLLVYGVTLVAITLPMRLAQRQGPATNYPRQI
ncbi:high-affinity iron transporter [uncultured Gammaproteobacteria bacterium]